MRSRAILSLLVMLAAMTAPPWVSAQATGSLVTVAGSGAAGFTGDNGPALQGSIDISYGIAVDSQKNIFVADTWNNRIRKLTAVINLTDHSVSWLITTLAGTGTAGNAGDLGLATQAQLNYPRGVAVDASGKVYVADTGNSRVRVITTDGIIHPFAGTGTPGSAGADGALATTVQLSAPRAVAVWGGNIMIADTLNARICFVDPNGKLYTYAGGPSVGYGYSGDGGPARQAQLGFIGALAADSQGQLFLSDVYNHVVRKIAADGVISTVAGIGQPGFGGDGGAALGAQLSYPRGLVVDSADNLFIADSGNNRVRMVSPDGFIRTTIGSGSAGFNGDGAVSGVQFNAPYGLALSSGALFVGDSRNYRVRVAQLQAPTPPVISAVVESAGGNAQLGVAINGLSTIYGTGLAEGTAQASTVPLPKVLAGTTVTVSAAGQSVQASLLFVSNRQINFQVPLLLPSPGLGLPQSVNVVVSVNGIASNTFTVKLASAAPGIFSLNGSGSGQGVILISPTTTLAAPAGGIPGATPASRGQSLSIYCSGLGMAMAGGVLTGTVNPVVVNLGNKFGLTPSSAGTVQGSAGLNQVIVTIPADAQTGNAVPLTLTSSGVTSNTVTVAIQ